MGKPRRAVFERATPVSSKTKAKAIHDIAAEISAATAAARPVSADRVRNAVTSAALGRRCIVPIYADQTREVVREIISPRPPSPPPLIPVNCFIATLFGEELPDFPAGTFLFGGMKRVNPGGKMTLQELVNTYPNPPWVPAGVVPPKMRAPRYGPAITEYLMKPPPGYVCAVVVDTNQRAPIGSMVSTGGPAPVIRPPPPTIRPSLPPPPPRVTLGRIPVFPSAGILEFASRYDAETGKWVRVQVGPHA